MTPRLIPKQMSSYPCWVTALVLLVVAGVCGAMIRWVVLLILWVIP